MKKYQVLLFALIMCIFIFSPDLALASVEGTLSNIQDKFLGTILPVLAVIGLIIAAFSFVMGSPNARSHLMLAVIGALVGFGAPSIVNFIRSLIQ